MFSPSMFHPKDKGTYFGGGEDISTWKHQEGKEGKKKQRSLGKKKERIKKGGLTRE